MPEEMLGGIASGLVGGGLGLLGTSQTNSANQAMALQQEQFAENMADTQYQRGVKDLQAAGLNPMLAYMSSAAPSPQGTSIANQNPGPGMQGAMQNTVDSAFDAKRLDNDTKANDAHVSNTIANTHLTEMRAMTEGSNYWSSKENARMSSLQREVMEKRLNTELDKAINDRDQEGYRRKYMGIDNIMKRLQNASGAAGSAADAYKSMGFSSALEAP